jgi:hypothetical protein
VFSNFAQVGRARLSLILGVLAQKFVSTIYFGRLQQPQAGKQKFSVVSSLTGTFQSRDNLHLIGDKPLPVSNLLGESFQALLTMGICHRLLACKVPPNQVANIFENSAVEAVFPHND